MENKIVKINSNLHQDLDVSAKLKFFYPVNVQMTIGHGVWLLYSKETFKPSSYEHILCTNNIDLFEKTLKLFETSLVTALADLPADIDSYELTYGMREGNDVGKYNC